MRVDIDPVRHKPAGNNKPGGGLKGIVHEVGLTYTELAFKWGSLLLALSIAYLLYGLYLTKARQYDTLPPQDAARFLRNFTLGLTLFKYSALSLCLATLIRFYNDNGKGQLLTFLGGVAYWGTPFIVGFAIPRTGPELTARLVGAGQIVGVFCLIPGVLIIIYDLYFKVQDAWYGRNKKSTVVKVPKDEPAFGERREPATFPWQCWNTSYCQPYVRDLCPRYTEKIPCWKIKEGCFCEEKIVFRALELKSDGSSFFRKMRHLLGTPQDRGIILTPSQKRERCKKCPIYAEHQRLKYRMLVPLTFPATVLFMWMFSKPLRAALEFGVSQMDKIIFEFSFSQSKSPAAVQDIQQILADAMASNIVYYSLMVLLGLILLTFVLRFIEWLMFRVQV